MNVRPIDNNPSNEILLPKVAYINIAEVPEYIKNILGRLESILNQKDTRKVAEDTLMYSTILQNAALYGKEK